MRTALAAILGAVVLLAPAFVFSGYHLFQLTTLACYAVAVLGLGLVTGTTGQISLGHGAFYAIGAYAAAIPMTGFDWPYWATLPLAAAVCFVLGFAVLVELALAEPVARLGQVYAGKLQIDVLPPWLLAAVPVAAAVLGWLGARLVGAWQLRKAV